MADILRPFGTLAVAASLAFSPVSVSASAQDLYQYETSSSSISSTSTSTSTGSSITSSSMQVSETIKVLDMGLPSYGDISAPKTSKNAIKGVEAEREKEKVKEGASTSASTSTSTKKAGGSTLFPTKEKKTTANKKTEKKQAAEKATATAAPLEIKKDDKKEENLKFVDMAMPSYSDNASAPKKSKFAF